MDERRLELLRRRRQFLRLVRLPFRHSSVPLTYRKQASRSNLYLYLDFKKSVPRKRILYVKIRRIQHSFDFFFIKSKPVFHLVQIPQIFTFKNLSQIRLISPIIQKSYGLKFLKRCIIVLFRQKLGKRGSNS